MAMLECGQLLVMRHKSYQATAAAGFVLLTLELLFYFIDFFIAALIHNSPLSAGYFASDREPGSASAIALSLSPSHCIYSTCDSTGTRHLTIGGKILCHPHKGDLARHITALFAREPCSVLTSSTPIFVPTGIASSSLFGDTPANTSSRCNLESSR